LLAKRICDVVSLRLLGPLASSHVSSSSHGPTGILTCIVLLTWDHWHPHMYPPPHMGPLASSPHVSSSSHGTTGILTCILLLTWDHWHPHMYPPPHMGPLASSHVSSSSHGPTSIRLPTSLRLGLRFQLEDVVEVAPDGALYRRLCVCVFVLCNRHWFNRVPGAHLGIACLPFTPPFGGLPVYLFTPPFTPYLGRNFPAPYSSFEFSSRHRRVKIPALPLPGKNHLMT
jgi:hypothetical protein